MSSMSPHVGRGGALKYQGSFLTSCSRLTAGLYVPRMDCSARFSLPSRRSYYRILTLYEIIIHFPHLLRPWQALVRSFRSEWQHCRRFPGVSSACCRH